MYKNVSVQTTTTLDCYIVLQMYKNVSVQTITTLFIKN